MAASFPTSTWAAARSDLLRAARVASSPFSVSNPVCFAASSSPALASAATFLLRFSRWRCTWAARTGMGLQLRSSSKQLSTICRFAATAASKPPAVPWISPRSLSSMLFRAANTSRAVLSFSASSVSLPEDAASPAPGAASDDYARDQPLPPWKNAAPCATLLPRVLPLRPPLPKPGIPAFRQCPKLAARAACDDHCSQGAWESARK